MGIQALSAFFVAVRIDSCDSGFSDLGLGLSV